MQVLLEKIRKGNLETQEFLANLIGVDVRTYQNKEAGVSQFKLNEMFVIANHYGKPIDKIFLPTNFEKLEEAKKETN